MRLPLPRAARDVDCWVEQVVVAEDVIPAKVRRFLSTYVDSIAQLEGLLLLYSLCLAAAPPLRR